MKNRGVLIGVGIFVAFVLIFASGSVFVDVVANRVIEKMSKDYCPSPYGPGVNPDKFDVNSFQRVQPPQQKQSPAQKRANYPWE